MPEKTNDYDVLVVGSGFGGSVSALRLTEKGYRVGVLECGRRFEDADHGATSWAVRRFLWAPRFGCTGIQRIHVLKDVVILAGAGVGGGSLVYANTLYEPKSDAFYRDQQWADITDWRTELAPYYDQAKRMLGVVTNPTTTPSDEVMRTVAATMGVADTYGPAPVGVFFGRDGAKEPGVEVPDPFFGGAGPRRSGCLECGECMTGCRHNAKNTLLKNYLYLAERAGADIHALTTVTDVRPRRGGGYEVETVPTTRRWGRKSHGRTFTSAQVIFAAGTWGTQSLLHQLKSNGTLPELSDRLGHMTRTNSESLCAAGVKLSSRSKHDFHQGVAITSSIHPDETTHIEPVRYGLGSQSMGLLTTVMTDGGGRVPRWLRWVGAALRHPGALLAVYVGHRDWSKRTIIALVMQTQDNSITVKPKASRRGSKVRLTSEQGHGLPNPTWIPAANQAVRLMAEEIDGAPYGSLGEIIDVPMTAHFLGGCAIGRSPKEGVVDAYHRVFGHEGLHVVDGSSVSANIGVNPSLTITAQAERAIALWPNKSEPDPRPALGSPYVSVAPVSPRAPVVPPTAPAALRLPIVEVRHGSPTTMQAAPPTHR